MHNGYLLRLALAVLLLWTCPAWCARQVALVAPGELPPPADHGIAKLEQALRAKGFAVTRTTSAASALTARCFARGDCRSPPASFAEHHRDL